MLAHIITYFRLKIGKEDQNRINERFGKISNLTIKKFNKYKQFCKNNNIQTKVIWLHAVSVGESLSVLNFVKKLSEKNYFIVFTTMTKTSADIIKDKLPKNSIHQYSVFQTRYYLNRFLNNWKPKIVFFVESEIFPTTITTLSKYKIPFYLLNARMSDRSYKKWSLVKFYIKFLLKKYSCIFPLSGQEENKFKILSDNQANIKNLGNLKIDNAIKNKDFIESSFNQQTSDVAKYKQLREKYKDTTIIVFGSIHLQEFQYLLQQYYLLTKKIKCIGIFVPRYLNECDILKDMATKINLKSIYWNNFEEQNDVDLLIINEMGILQKIYKICDISVVCGNFTQGIGGHNPLESIVFYKPTFVGKYCSKSQDLINQLLQNNLIIQTMNLSEEITNFIKNYDNNKIYEFKKNTDLFFEKNKNVADNIIRELKL